MKYSSKSVISGGIILLAFILLILYIYKNLSNFKQLFITALSPINLFFILIIALIFLIFLLLNGILLNILMYPFGLRLKFKEYFGLSVITNFYNYITPFHGGMMARAVYLKKKHKFPYVHFLATLSAIYVIIFLIGSFIGLLSMLFIWLYYGLFNYIIFYLFLVIFVFLLSIIIFSPKLPESRKKWLNRFIKVINGWHLIKNNKKIIFATALISLIQLILGAVSTVIIYNIFGIYIGFFKALFIASIGSIAILVSITPGNLGIGDAINVFSAAIVGISITEAVAAAVLGRAVNLLIIFILGPIFSYILLKKAKEEKNDKIKK